ncbi:hypothetical protein [Schleiferilactobacillus perolens]|jgi:hypothetical protein|nr:hypothetical protein [Schleiferilactobacillus perolens]MCI1892062.1 hypothetical protein [Schleiferilactobacillus harbinensis]MCI1913757.1 hypothetical protein [Schleiferilactobacillus harbinensis]MCI2171365.1 hypothetical protein [Schleiferilactobacillus perolens]
MKKVIHNNSSDSQDLNPWHNPKFRTLHALVWSIIIPVLAILKYSMHLF